MNPEKSASGQILMFPTFELNATQNVESRRAIYRSHAVPCATNLDRKGTSGHRLLTPAQTRDHNVVLSGTFRKDLGGLKLAFEQLRSSGCRILSPTNVDVVSEEHGFVFMRGEQYLPPDQIELHHLDAIQRSEFMWLHAPEGYVGVSAALEVGFARASGIPVYSAVTPSDPILCQFVTVVEDPKAVIELTQLNPAVPSSLRAFQHYYRRVAAQRGYEKESARDCVLLMVEEVGELARAIRKREKLSRRKSRDEDPALELADVFIYVIHLANVLGIDLPSSIMGKELINHSRSLQVR